ncbi:alpha/beta fold hydrolase [Stenotrophomonas sp. NPDC087984]|uniref:alpha/beta fold hydrolase n=1 Tax=Streptomyces violaceusniger TaxID=68280 RepID=UPI00368BF0CE
MAVRLPGRESLLDQPPIADLPAVAERPADAIRTHAGEARIILCGHSSGSVLAYETARALEPETAALLAVSAQQAPGTPVRTAPGAGTSRTTSSSPRSSRAATCPPSCSMARTSWRWWPRAPALRADYRATYEYLTGTTR